MSKEFLTPKQEAFCVAYTTIGGEGFGNGGKSAIIAGYSENGAYARASELLTMDKIRKRINELYKQNLEQNNVTSNSVLANIRHDRILARNSGQISSAVRCDELEGKFLAMFTDNINQNQPQQPRSIPKDEEKELKKYAAFLLRKRQQKKDQSDTAKEIPKPIKRPVFNASKAEISSTPLKKLVSEAEAALFSQKNEQLSLSDSELEETALKLDSAEKELLSQKAI